jgi:predicted peroxiredoxin
MAKVVYVISRDPYKDTESVSAVFAQALTALSFDYECEIFLMDDSSWTRRSTSHARAA